MSKHKPDPATVAFDALALDTLRRHSRSDAAHRCDDTKTTLYVRSRPTLAHPARPRAALFQTMTVRAVAALSSATSSARRAHPPARRRIPRAYARWSLAFAGAALAGSAAALLTATLIAARAPTPPAHAAKVSPPATAIIRRPSPPRPPPTPSATAPATTASAPAAIAAGALHAPAAARVSRARPATTASAVDALAAGDYPTALARYRELAAREPEQPVFAAIVRMLERDLAHDCDAAAAPAGTACAR